MQNAQELGEYTLDALTEIMTRHTTIGDVRGKGLMIGVEFFLEAGGARQYCKRLMKKGLLCKETHEHTIRFAPPLIITKEEVDWALERIEQVLGMR